MHIQEFTKRTLIHATAEEVFDWHMRPGAFGRLLPPWEKMDVIELPATLDPGSRAIFDLHMGPLRQRWVAEHTALERGRMFRDIQVTGPFAMWEHTHGMEPDADPSRSWLVDHVRYALPMGALGATFGSRFARAKLDALFAYRHAVTLGDVEEHRAWKGTPPMKILVSGAHGMVGGALISFLAGGGHEVVRLVRGDTAQAGEIAWDANLRKLDPESLEGIDAVVHLAGDPIGERRWTPRKKSIIRYSRTGPTRFLAETCVKLQRPPRVFACASAIGIYGSRGEETLTESSAPGAGFLADVCREWEESTAPAASAGIRTVNLRIGVVLSPVGGALKKMLFPFRMGGGGTIGDGRQWMSWIALDDAIGAIHRALMDGSLAGAVNVVAPEPVTNLDFTRALGRVLNRPTLFAMPAFGARMAFGEFADECLLASQRVLPAKLLAAGHKFRYPSVEFALRGMLGRPAA